MTKQTLKNSLQVVLLFFIAADIQAATHHWPQFRGPYGRSIAPDQRLPKTFGPNQNKQWKIPLPPGPSSPCIWGDRIYLTGHEGAEYFSFGAGTDITELLHGLEGDMCQCPHWGYVVRGSITAIYTGGLEETVSEGDLFYWPPGHSVRAEDDTDIVMFSPQHEHSEVIAHVLQKVST